LCPFLILSSLLFSWLPLPSSPLNPPPHTWRLKPLLICSTDTKLEVLKGTQNWEMLTFIWCLESLLGWEVGRGRREGNGELLLHVKNAYSYFSG
jgi:hypothetical protein